MGMLVQHEANPLVLYRLTDGESIAVLATSVAQRTTLVAGFSFAAFEAFTVRGMLPGMLQWDATRESYGHTGGGFGDPVELAQRPIGGLPVGALGLASVGRADVEFVEQCHQTVDVGGQLLLRSPETARGERFVDVGDAPAGEGLGTAHVDAPA